MEVILLAGRMGVRSRTVTVEQQAPGVLAALRRQPVVHVGWPRGQPRERDLEAANQAILAHSVVVIYVGGKLLLRQVPHAARVEEAKG